MTAVKGQLATRERPCDSLERQLTGGKTQQGCYGIATHDGRLCHYKVYESHLQWRKVRTEKTPRVCSIRERGKKMTH